MRFIAIDIESNQPSGKIIQLGAASFDTDRPEHLDEFSVFLTIDEPINWDQALRGGQTLGELLAWDAEHYHHWQIPKQQGYQMFWDWVAEQQCGKRMVHWGGGDLINIIAECHELDVVYPHRLQSIDAKHYYKNLWKPAGNIKGTAGLGAVCQLLELYFIGTPHDALHDAINCGRVFQRMYQDLVALNKIKKVLT